MGQPSFRPVDRKRVKVQPTLEWIDVQKWVDLHREFVSANSGQRSRFVGWCAERGEGRAGRDPRASNGVAARELAQQHS